MDTRALRLEARETRMNSSRKFTVRILAISKEQNYISIFATIVNSSTNEATMFDVWLPRNIACYRPLSKCGQSVLATLERETVIKHFYALRLCARAAKAEQQPGCSRREVPPLREKFRRLTRNYSDVEETLG